MIVQLRHSVNTGNTPVALADGEVALNAVDQLLYYKHANGAVVILANGASILTFSTAQISSNLNQVPANTSAYRITFNTSNILVGISHTPGNSRITVSSNGWYDIMATGNYRRTSGGDANRFSDSWLQHNGTNTLASPARTGVPLAARDNPMVLHALVYLVANDYIELLQAVDSTNGGTGLRSRNGLTGAPDTPSVSLSIIKIAN